MTELRGWVSAARHALVEEDYDWLGQCLDGLAKTIDSSQDTTMPEECPRCGGLPPGEASGAGDLCYCSGDDASREAAKRKSVRGPSPTTYIGVDDARRHAEDREIIALQLAQDLLDALKQARREWGDFGWLTTETLVMIDAAIAKAERP